MFDISLDEQSRVVTATLTPGCTAKPGDRYLIQSGDRGEVLVFNGHRQVACIANPSPGLTEALHACHGMAPATVERVGGFGDTVELELK
jgi:hypothetical protein